jgi:hypothetical protein
MSGLNRLRIRAPCRCQPWTSDWKSPYCYSLNVLFCLYKVDTMFYFPCVMHSRIFTSIKEIRSTKKHIKHWNLTSSQPWTSEWKSPYFYSLNVFVLFLQSGHNVFISHVSCIAEYLLRLRSTKKHIKHWNLTSSVSSRWVCGLSSLLFLLWTSYLTCIYNTEISVYIDAHGREISNYSVPRTE